MGVLPKIIFCDYAGADMTPIDNELIEKICGLINEYNRELKKDAAVDLGLGSDEIAELLVDNGTTVAAIDIAKTVSQSGQAIDESQQFDIIIVTQSIASLDILQCQSFFSELTHIVKKDGVVICAKTLNMNVKEPLQTFAESATKEFEILEWHLAFHRLYNAIHDLLRLPEKLCQLTNDSSHHVRLAAHNRTTKLVFKYMAGPCFKPMWRLLSLFTKPLIYMINLNHSLLILEMISYKIWGDYAASDAIFAARRKSFT